MTKRSKRKRRRSWRTLSVMVVAVTIAPALWKSGFGCRNRPAGVTRWREKLAAELEPRSRSSWNAAEPRKTPRELGKPTRVTIHHSAGGKYTREKAEDVAETIRACLATDRAIGKIYDVGGADEVSYEEFHVRIMNVLGHSRKRLHIPWRLALVLARGFEAVLPRPPLTRDNVYYFVPWPPCNLGPIRRELGIQPTGLDAGLRHALEAPA